MLTYARLSSYYAFVKPNDVRALHLMNAAAQHTLSVLPDIVIAYGHSDEYSFVFHKNTSLFERRTAKITSTVVSTFTAAYVHLWPLHFSPSSQDEQASVGTTNVSTEVKPLDLNHLPTFDARAVCYPSIRNFRDYLSWRQADCHINNLYNTTFWALVQQGRMSNTEAEEFLKGTFSADKNEILFSKFGINYNNELEIFKKGSTVLREYKLEEPPVAPSTSTAQALLTADAELEEVEEQKELSKTQKEKSRKTRQKAQIVVVHPDIIKDDFWLRRPWLLTGKPGVPLNAHEQNS